MITTKRPGTNDYTQAGFIKAKDNNGVYHNIDKIYDNQGNTVFQQGYLNEYQGADDFSIPTIGKPLLDYTIYGNTIQNGTPTPDSPIEPEFVGERTENLYDINSNNVGYYDSSTGELVINGNRKFWLIKVNPGDTIYMNNQGARGNGCFFDSNMNRVGAWGYNRSSIVVPEGVSFATNSYVLSAKDAMVTLNQPIPTEFVPYGYKIPISSAGQTKNIYLSEPLRKIGDYADELNYASGTVTRRIKEYIFTGEEAIDSGHLSEGVFNYRDTVGALLTAGVITTSSTHFVGKGNVPAWSAVASGDITFFAGSGAAWENLLYLRVDRYISITTIADFKAWLAQQYSSGAPVKIWYVLATPTTESIDLPEIPTAKGTTVIDVETTVPPSEVDVKYRGSYKPSYQLFLAQNGDSFEAKDGQSLYIKRDEKITIYGWHVDPSILNPSDAITYLADAVGKTPASMGASTFNYGSWQNAFFMPKPCMLYYDGTVAYYLDPNDYTKKADGTHSDVSNPNFPGNAMMEWPLIWYKFDGGTVDGEGYFYVANKQVDDTYHCWCNYDCNDNIIPHFYTAIYNSTSFETYSASNTYAAGDRVVYDSKLYNCTTAIDTAEAFDSDKWEVISDTAPAINQFRSLSGVKLSERNGCGYTTGAVEVTRATANNITSDVEWYTDVYSDRILINALLVLMGKSINTQATFGRGLDSGSEATKNAYETGSLNDKGLFWGVTANGNSGVKVFGMENWWACVWRRTAGCVGVSGNYKIKLTYGAADGTTVTGYNNNGNGYIDLGVRPATGYIRSMQYSQYGYVPSVTTGASNSTYYSDYYYSGNGYLLLGGGSDNGTDCGAFYFTLDYAFSASNWSVSAALSCKPGRKG